MRSIVSALLVAIGITAPAAADEIVLTPIFGIHTVEMDPKTGPTTRIFPAAVAGTRVFIKGGIQSYRKYKVAFEYALPSWITPETVVSAHLQITETGARGPCPTKAGFVLSSFDGNGTKEVDDVEGGDTVIEVSAPPGAGQLFPQPVDVTDEVRSQIKGPVLGEVLGKPPSGYIGFNVRPTDNDFCIRYLAAKLIITMPGTAGGIRG